MRRTYLALIAVALMACGGTQSSTVCDTAGGYHHTGASACATCRNQNCATVDNALTQMCGTVVSCAINCGASDPFQQQCGCVRSCLPTECAAPFDATIQCMVQSCASDCQ